MFYPQCHQLVLINYTTVPHFIQTQSLFPNLHSRNQNARNWSTCSVDRFLGGELPVKNLKIAQTKRTLFLFPPNHPLFLSYPSSIIAFNFSSPISVVHRIVGTKVSINSAFKNWSKFHRRADSFEWLFFFSFPVWIHDKLKTQIELMCSI